MKHLITMIRDYLGITQTQLARAVGVTQADISEMENHTPYGWPVKYQRLSNYLGIPVEALVRNDPRLMTEEFFSKHPAPTYTAVPASPDQLLGRLGEEFILQRERERLQKSYPALAELVTPFYKMKGNSPGYDIRSFDDAGKPLHLEVKTSLHKTNGFRITNHELEVAQKMTEAGEQYIFCYISCWGTEEQHVLDLPFQEIYQTHRIAPCYYFCKPKPEVKSGPVSGLQYYRMLRGLRQEDIASALRVTQSEWCLYEKGEHRPSIQFYMEAGTILDATVDQLLEQYDRRPLREEIVNGKVQ